MESAKKISAVTLVFGKGVDIIMHTGDIWHFIVCYIINLIL